jgi:DNA-directed RNA polymerase III subunit RPC3
VGEVPGATFIVASLTPATYLKNCSEVLCRTALECIVRERFGSKACRVFRLLLMKKMLEQKQVSDMAMIPAKEAKEILYTLLAEGFVSLQVLG